MEKEKNGQAYCIAPLNQLFLASFRTWENAEGAGRTELTRGKGRKKSLGVRS